MPSHGEAITWVEEPATFEFKKGVCCVRVQSGDAEIAFRCSPATLLGGIKNATAAYASFLAGRTAKVLPMVKYARLRPIKVKGDEI